MTGRPRLAILGAGYFGQFHYRAWARLPVEITAFCDIDETRRATVGETYPQARAYDDFLRLLDAERPDFVDIVSPPPTHLPAIRACAERGISVICQKPFCGAIEAAEEAVAIAERAGIMLIVHENFRFQPWYAAIHDKIASGDLGAALGATFRLRPGDGQGPDAYLARQPYFRTMPRFMVHETGVHYIDVFRYLFGEITAVTARLRRLNPAIAGEDAGVAVFEFAKGVTAVLDANRLADHKAQNHRLTLGEMMIEMEGGVLRLTGDGEVLLRRHGETAETPVAFSWDDIDFGGDCVFRTCQAALAALTGQAAPVNTARDYIENLRIEEAVYASHSQGRRIDLA